MAKLGEGFNKSFFSHFLNSAAGRVFRVAAGLGFLIIGILFRSHIPGAASIVWSFFPLSAGTFDICYISVMLGGPLSGAKIRSAYSNN